MSQPCQDIIIDEKEKNFFSIPSISYAQAAAMGIETTPSPSSSPEKKNEPKEQQQHEDTTFSGDCDEKLMVYDKEVVGEGGIQGIAPDTPLCLRCGGLWHTRETCKKFKVQFCRYQMVGDGECMFRFQSQMCPYAHDVSEIRNPYLPVCVRIIRTKKGEIFDLGCGTVGATFGQCCKNKILKGTQRAELGISEENVVSGKEPQTKTIKTKGRGAKNNKNQTKGKGKGKGKK